MVRDNFDHLKVPTKAYITFEDEEAYLRAININVLYAKYELDIYIYIY